MKTIIFTAISGSDTSGYLDGFRQMAGDRKRVQIVDAGDTIKKVLRIRDLGAERGRLLSLDDEIRLKTLVPAYMAIADELDKWRQSGSVDAVVVDTHARFWWESRWRDAIDPDSIAKLKPELFVTLIDNVADIKQGQLSDDWADVGMSKILEWRAEEARVTHDEWARRLQADYYLVMKEDPREMRVGETLYRLVFQPDLPKVYVSYPISHLAGKDLAEIRRFIKKLRKHAIVFNPNWLNDMDDVRKSSTQHELARAMEEAENHTVQRDYELIERADMVVTLPPNPRTRAILCRTTSSDIRIYPLYGLSGHSPPQPPLPPRPR